MNYRIVAAAVAALVLMACGQKGSETNAQSAQAEEIYSGTGKVTAVAGDQVTIAHGAIEGIGWPAMTMTFTAPADIANAAKAGDQVSFSFREEGGAYLLTSLQRR